VENEQGRREPTIVRLTDSTSGNRGNETKKQGKQRHNLPWLEPENKKDKGKTVKEIFVGKKISCERKNISLFF